MISQADFPLVRQEAEQPIQLEKPAKLIVLAEIVWARKNGMPWFAIHAAMKEAERTGRWFVAVCAESKWVCQ